MPVPAVLSEGIKEADVKNFAEKATAHINKGLGECMVLPQTTSAARPAPQVRWMCRSTTPPASPSWPVPPSPHPLPTPRRSGPPAAYARRLATGREPVLTGSVVGVLYFVGRLAGLVSIVGLAYTAVLAAFTAPKASAWGGGPCLHRLLR